MRHSARGFSLLEITFAIGIIGVMVVSTSLLLQRIPVSGREARDQDVALKIARGEIESLRANGYDALPSTGSFTNTLLTSLASSSAAVTITTYNSKTKKIDASVYWRGDKAFMHSLTLTTLMTQNSELP